MDKNNYTNIDSLKSRVILSNQSENKAVFISIHHDSVSEKYLEFHSGLCDGLGGKKINESFKKQFQIGFNIFYKNGSLSVYKSSKNDFNKKYNLIKILYKIYKNYELLVFLSFSSVKYMIIIMYN